MPGTANNATVKRPLIGRPDWRSLFTKQLTKTVDGNTEIIELPVAAWRRRHRRRRRPSRESPIFYSRFCGGPSR